MNDLQAARLDRIRAKELANKLRCDVISDVVLLDNAGDGLDTACMGSDLDGADANLTQTTDVGGGVWKYLFPGELQGDSVAARGGSIRKGGSIKEGEVQLQGLGAFGTGKVLEHSSGAGPDEPHSWGGVHLRLFRDRVPPPSLRLPIKAVLPLRRDGLAQSTAGLA